MESGLSTQPDDLLPKLNPPIRGKERDALKIIRRWQEEYRNSPTVHELAAEIKMSRSGTMKVLYRLFDKGYIDMIQKGRRYLIVPLYWE